MTQLFIQLAMSVTGAVITIVALLLVAAIIGFLTAWFYAKSVYTPKIKVLEADKVSLNAQVDSLKADKVVLNAQVDSLKADKVVLNTQVDSLKDDISKLIDKTEKLNEKVAQLGMKQANDINGKFKVSKARDGQIYFNLKDVDDQTILKSEMYTTREACNNGIESVRKNCNDTKKYERLESSDNRYYFNLKAANGQIIGTSQMYDTQNLMEEAIESVKMNGESTIVEEDLV